MSTWLSIDCDFFYDGPDDTTRAPTKRLCLQPASLCDQIPLPPNEIHLAMDHNELLACWDAAQVRGLRCVHFDAHHDLFVDYNRAWELPLGARGARVGVGDHLFHALREGIVAELTWVLPGWMSVDVATRELRARLGGHLARAVRAVPFAAWRPDNEAPRGAFVCLSPEWTPQRDLPAFEAWVGSLGAAEPLITRWRHDAEARYRALAEGADPLSLRFPFGRGTPGGAA